jgi:uncharacterized OsmC-like protein
MNAEDLRRLQLPLKTLYKNDPRAALVTLRARGRVSQESLTFAVETGKPGAPIGLHPATGGDGSAACSADMLLEALAGCAGVTLVAVATAMSIELRSTTITAEGDLDFRGTLGVAKDVPVGFSDIRLVFELDTAVDADKARKLIELTERYCVVLQTLSRPPSIHVHTRTPATRADAETGDPDS